MPLLSKTIEAPLRLLGEHKVDCVMVGGRAAAIVWIRHRIPMLNLIVRGLLHTIDDHEEPPNATRSSEALLCAAHADLIQVAQKIRGIVIDAVSAGSLQFLTAVAAGQ